MGKPQPKLLGPGGHPILRNPARVEFAADALRKNGYGIVVDLIMDRWGVSKCTAKRDIAAAKQLIALELDAAGVRAAEVTRNERIADKAEALADRAAARQEYAAAASLHRAASAASREVSRLTGAYAPKEVNVKHSVAPELPLQLDAILAILSPERGQPALRIVLEEIEAAKASGRLASAPPDDVVDAEVVEETPGAN